MNKNILININNNKNNPHLSISFKNIILFTIPYPIESNRLLFEKCKESGITSILLHKSLYPILQNKIKK